MPGSIPTPTLTCSVLSYLSCSCVPSSSLCLKTFLCLSQHAMYCGSRHASARTVAQDARNTPMSILVCRALWTLPRSLLPRSSGCKEASLRLSRYVARCVHCHALACTVAQDANSIPASKLLMPESFPACNSGCQNAFLTFKLRKSSPMLLLSSGGPEPPCV
jgi:hypothetical protein